MPQSRRRGLAIERRSGPHRAPARPCPHHDARRGALAELERRGTVRLPVARDAPSRDAGSARRGRGRRANGSLRPRVAHRRADAVPARTLEGRRAAPASERRRDPGRDRRPGGERWLASLSRSINRAPRNATFGVVPGRHRGRPRRAGLALDLEASRRPSSGPPSRGRTGLPRSS